MIFDVIDYFSFFQRRQKKIESKRGYIKCGLFQSIDNSYLSELISLYNNSLNNCNDNNNFNTNAKFNCNNSVNNIIKNNPILILVKT